VKARRAESRGLGRARYPHLAGSAGGEDCLRACAWTAEVLERCFGELARYYRQASAGSRCRGLVHRLNSPLQVISFQLELLEQKSREELEILSGSGPLKAGPLAGLRAYRLEKFSQLRASLEELQDLSRSILLQGFHEESQERLQLDLNQIFRQELALYENQPAFKHRVETRCRFQETLPPIEGLYIDFSQSFRFLVDNALEAMEGEARRELTVETDLKEGCRLLRVGDIGVGIPPEIRPRIFDPFFTTKGTQESPRAGLGLFMAQRLLAPYRGQIEVDSRPGETWVTVRLPLDAG
jgi:signal transduction histidine kinase